MPLFYPKLPKLMHRICVPILRIIFKVFNKIEVKGLENLPTERESLIFASNHASELDPLLVGSFVPKRFRPLFFTARGKDFYTRSGWRKLIYGGLLFDIFGGYRMDSGQKDYAKTLRKHIQLLRDGYSLSIFPEGVRTLDGSLSKARGGVVYLAETTNTKIIPVGIKGNFGIKFWKFILGKNKLSIQFGKPIDIKEVSGDYQEKAQYIMVLIEELL